MAKEINMYSKLFFLAVAMTAILFGSTIGLAQTASKNEEVFADKLKEIQQTSGGGRADATVLLLEAIAESLKADDVAPPTRCKVMQQALRSVLGSNAAKDDSVRAIAAKCALDTITETQRKGVANSELLQLQLELALYVMPRTTAPTERTAEMALSLWGNLAAAVRHFSIYDPLHPKVSFDVVPPTPPADFKEPFNFGQSPDTIKHPVFRKQYADYLRNRADFGRGANEYQRLCSIQKLFLPKLHGILKSAYSGSTQKTKEGETTIEKYVPDPAMRKELLNLIQSPTSSQN